jgi:hypothetical protein
VTIAPPRANEVPAPTPAAPTRDDIAQLVDQALTTPTVESLDQFVGFAARFRKLAAYNLYMVYMQRPGASAVATREEWQEVGQTVLPDAVPIVILRTFGPIERVYELSDTSPQQVRDPRTDMFGAEGAFDARILDRLIKKLKDSKRNLKIEVKRDSYGSKLAGTAAAPPPTLVGLQDLMTGKIPTGQLAHGNFHTDVNPSEKIDYRIKLNRRLTAAEQFTTLAHELGHIFCGHLGGYSPNGRKDDESGWPDRRGLKHSAREIEAEIVAWMVASRVNLITGAPLYLKPHLMRAKEDGSIGTVKPDLIIRSVARIERMMRG